MSERPKYTPEMFARDRDYKERERQHNMTATTVAIEVLEEASQLEPSVDLRHPIAVLRNELERMRS